MPEKKYRTIIKTEKKHTTIVTTDDLRKPQYLKRYGFNGGRLNNRESNEASNVMTRTPKMNVVADNGD